MGNTGYKSFASLELYYTDDNSYAGMTKANISTDPDYIAPVLDTEACAPSARYYNTEISRSAAKKNCNSGYFGSIVTLTALANQFVSSLSAADANAQAIAWLDNNVQIHANNVGTCELDSTPPTSPSLSYSLISPTALTLSWTSSTDNLSVTGYDIYKDGILLDSTAANILNYSVTGLSENTAYGFYVKAKDAAGNSSNSNITNVITLPNILLLEPATSVIFEKQASSWVDCRSAVSADFQYTSDNVLGAGTNGTTFYLNRYRGIVDTSSIIARPQSAKIIFKFSTNTVGPSLTFNLFASNTKILSNQTLQLTDWNDWNEASYIGNVTVPSNSTSYNEILLTSDQLDLLNSEQAYNFFLISNGDKENLTPSTNIRPTLSMTEGGVYLECTF
jgi:hypothetical protein